MRLIDADELREGIRKLHKFYGADDVSRNALAKVDSMIIAMMHQKQPKPNKLDEMIKSYDTYGNAAYSVRISDMLHEINNQLKLLRGERD